MKKKDIKNWFEHSNAITKTPSSGTYIASDNDGTAISLQWHKVGMLTPEFVALMASISDLGITAFTNVEMQFLHAYPEAVGTDTFLEPYESLFKNGIQSVDWQQTEQVMQNFIKNYFVFANATITDEMINVYATRFIFWCVTAKNTQTNQLLGYITYEIHHDYAYGLVKVSSIAVARVAQKHGVGTLLMSSIFNIVPDIQHIFLHTRVTNTTTLAACRAWGFVENKNPTQDASIYHVGDLKYSVFMEYDAQKTKTLQKVSATLVDSRQK